jgi:hypothetical protein
MHIQRSRHVNESLERYMAEEWTAVRKARTLLYAEVYH